MISPWINSKASPVLIRLLCGFDVGRDRKRGMKKVSKFSGRSYWKSEVAITRDGRMLAGRSGDCRHQEVSFKHKSLETLLGIQVGESSWKPGIPERGQD